MNITLKTPIQRGDSTIAEVELRKPVAGELIGAPLVALLQMDVTALLTVLPRITLPSLTEVEVAALDPSDLLKFGAAISGFMMNPSKTQPTTQE